MSSQTREFFENLKRGN